MQLFREKIRTTLICAAFLLCLIPCSARIDFGNGGHWFFEGDVQLRYESHDTTRPATLRQERIRLTTHQVLGVRVSETTTIRVGARTGSSGNQHTPTISLLQLDGNHGLGSRTYFLDRWEAEYHSGPLRIRFGRMLWPFWSANGYLWDTDITPAGVFASHAWEQGDANTSLAAAIYALPDGARSFTGTALSAQWHHTRPLGGGALRGAIQWLQVEGGRRAVRPRARNNERDYGIGQISVSYGWTVKGVPLTVGTDVFRNFTSYGPEDPFAYANRDERNGFGFGISWGQNKKAGDWRLRYHYTHQETLSVNPSLSEDAFSRLGTSNYRGHDFRVIYSIRDPLTVTARYVISEEIVGDASGDRFRLDVKYTF